MMATYSDLSTNASERVVYDHQGCSSSAEQRRDSRDSGASYVASIGFDNQLCIWETETGLLFTSVNFPSKYDGPEQLYRSGDGNRLAISDGKSIFIWTFNSGSYLHIVKTMYIADYQSIYSLCLNFDGSQIMSGHDDGFLCNWDVESGEML